MDENKQCESALRNALLAPINVLFVSMSRYLSEKKNWMEEECY